VYFINILDGTIFAVSAGVKLDLINLSQVFK